jgi:hypothetical protein
MDVIAGLTPMVVVGAAFVAIVVFVKRLADREARAERAVDEGPDEPAQVRNRAVPPRRGTATAGPRVHMVPVDPDGDEPAPDGEKPTAG